jgi:hypothetical protein
VHQAARGPSERGEADAPAPVEQGERAQGQGPGSRGVHQAIISFAGINLAASIVQHPLQNCRLYHLQVTVDPQKSIDYVQRNRNKKAIYRSFVTNSYISIWLETFN